MSNKEFAKTQSYFPNDERVRIIVQEEIEDLFSQIKTEIERKIKQIDRNILELKSDVQDILKQKTQPPAVDLAEVFKKLESLENTVSNLEKYKKEEIEKINSGIREKSAEKERSSLFKKTSTAPNLQEILFGQENIEQNSHLDSLLGSKTDDSHKNKSKFGLAANPKPPLPNASKKEEPRTKEI